MCRGISLCRETLSPLEGYWSTVEQPRTRVWGQPLLSYGCKCRVHISSQSLGVLVCLSVPGKRAEMPVIFPPTHMSEILEVEWEVS